MSEESPLHERIQESVAAIGERVVEVVFSIFTARKANANESGR